SPKPSSSSTLPPRSSPSSIQITTSVDLRGENEILRKRVLELEAEISELKQETMPFLNKEAYGYLKRACASYGKHENVKSGTAQKIAEQLPLTVVELKECLNSQWTKTSNNLLQNCFKHVDLSTSNYQLLAKMNLKMLMNIKDYVTAVHPSETITQSSFSKTVSLKCRHIREKQGKQQNDRTLKEPQKNTKSKRQNNHDANKENEQDETTRWNRRIWRR
ncbi:unnamed protein product, partial [Didymodactylos carnosus]